MNIVALYSRVLNKKGSFYVRIPKHLADLVGLEPGQRVRIGLEDRKIIVFVK